MRGPSRRCAAISLASLENGVQLAAHIADAGYAVGEEERQNKIGSVSSSVIEIDVGMHIPQAGDEVFALGIDDLSCLGIAAARGSNTGDAVSADRYRGVGLRLARNRVDHGYVGDAERLCASRRDVKRTGQKQSLPACAPSDSNRLSQLHHDGRMVRRLGWAAVRDRSRSSATVRPPSAITGNGRYECRDCAQTPFAEIIPKGELAAPRPGCSARNASV